MLTDLVVDTNVLLHASNPNEPRFGHAKSLVEGIPASGIILCVDSGFSFISSQNRSQIGSEYIEHLRVGTLGYEIISILARTGRIVPISRSVDRRQAKIINQTVVDKTDRVFVKIAINSNEHILVSHDFVAFPDRVRRNMRGQIETVICDCLECLVLF